MPDLKEIHARIRAKKDEKKKVNTVFKDVLAQSKPYQDVLDELKKLKAKKAQIENEIRSDFGKEMEQLERIALDVKTDEILLTDLSLTMLMKGQPLDLTDENDVKYEPVFRITFKKTV
jgi:predicted nuclease with TOPRIM domain